MADEKSQPNKKWKKEVSAGGIVYKKQDGRVFVLLIKPRGPNYGPPRGYWTFPKGLVDHDGEDLKETALREVREEGGVSTEIEKELGYVKYFRGASSGFYPALKFVHYYLMKYLNGDPADHDKEVAEARWFDLSEVPDNLKLPHDKEIFARAAKELNASI